MVILISLITENGSIAIMYSKIEVKIQNRKQKV